MITIQNNKSCSGCAACYNICPKNCITMVSDQEGFLYPKVDNTNCINCGLCEKSCPIISQKQEIPQKQAAFLAQHIDDDIRRESSAGGAFSAIASDVLDRNGVAFGAAFDNRFHVNHIYIEDKSELFRFRNSKYVQSVIGKSYTQVKKFLDQERMVCFSGTPCQIEGLRSFLNKDYDNLILVDVVCHGIPSPLVWDKYLEYQDIRKKSIDNILFRDKYYGYKYSTMSFQKNEKNIYHAGSQMDPMLRAYFSDICDRPICYECPFKRRYRNSDITIWDCFSVYDFDKKFDDDRGTTRVLCHSSKGEEIIRSSDKLRVIEVDPDKLVCGVKEMFESVSMNSRRSEFFDSVMKMSGKELFSHYFPITVSVRIKTFIRLILLRTGLYRLAKRINNKLVGR